MNKAGPFEHVIVMIMVMIMVNVVEEHVLEEEEETDVAAPVLDGMVKTLAEVLEASTKRWMIPRITTTVTTTTTTTVHRVDHYVATKTRPSCPLVIMMMMMIMPFHGMGNGVVLLLDNQQSGAHHHRRLVHMRTIVDTIVPHHHPHCVVGIVILNLLRLPILQQEHQHYHHVHRIVVAMEIISLHHPIGMLVSTTIIRLVVTSITIDGRKRLPPKMLSLAKRT
jgi:hypothetical protein